MSTPQKPNHETILIVDDKPEILNTLQRMFRRQFRVLVAAGGQEALQILDEEQVAVILSDQRMPGMDGVSFLSRSREIQPEAVRLMITGYADIGATIDAVNKANIYQYISKPFEPEELERMVRNAVEKFRLEQQNKQLQEQLMLANQKLRNEKNALQKQVEKQLELGHLIGNSPKMLQVLKLVRKVVDTPTTVLLLGETGTGKELLAKILHYNSNRKDNMFVVQNCGAIPDTLLQSELFGHIKGAFTGAVKDKKGLFELAHQGTIFLDEIGDTSPALQLGLLRVLQEGEVKPVGSNQVRKVDVRVVAATNRDLQTEVGQGRFREDLYYRLSVFPIVLPPLKERREDIPDLMHFFVTKYASRIDKTIQGVDPSVIQTLKHADFPGNIRELENEIERMITLADDGALLTADLLSSRFKEKSDIEEKIAGYTHLKAATAHLEKRMIGQALNEHNGNILRAAEQLGISRVGLHKMLKRHEIDASFYKQGNSGT